MRKARTGHRLSGPLLVVALLVLNWVTEENRMLICSPEGKSPRQCLKEGNCRALKNSFFECKRSMLDARSRFRGRKGY
ncbi:PREDICTED: cytochrome c oxidase assembly factor 5 [Myotis brandtii]|uniref:cytochrome c oxidase assembly factor 5 n=1 Tax=Myotis brandtii TaxID=109478 RepID=UPI0003BB722E|nr:PREDICTED: cytochrome c oxidase assembly factor 5 [Myotis brandtii]